MYSAVRYELSLSTISLLIYLLLAILPGSRLASSYATGLRIHRTPLGAHPGQDIFVVAVRMDMLLGNGLPTHGYACLVDAIPAATDQIVP